MSKITHGDVVLIQGKIFGIAEWPLPASVSSPASHWVTTLEGRGLGWVKESELRLASAEDKANLASHIRNFYSRRKRATAPQPVAFTIFGISITVQADDHVEIYRERALTAAEIERDAEATVACDRIRIRLGDDIPVVEIDTCLSDDE